MRGATGQRCHLQESIAHRQSTDFFSRGDAWNVTRFGCPVSWSSVATREPRPQWTDAFQPDRGDGRGDVAFEKAALMFNLGAISSQVALGADLASERGVKSAARSYQVRA